jgi:hypothetical protein
MFRQLAHHCNDSRFANEEALLEIARVLKPTAVLGLIWNVEDCMAAIFLPIGRVAKDSCLFYR